MSDDVGLSFEIQIHIYIIETKLAKNPQVKREVIGQIMEYSANLWEKEAEWFDAKARARLL